MTAILLCRTEHTWKSKFEASFPDSATCIDILGKDRQRYERPEFGYIIPWILFQAIFAVSDTVTHHLLQLCFRHAYHIPTSGRYAV